ncbi:hypothetical protein ACFQ34_20660 [Pseudonocardia benzenivorans]|uniref:ATP synthase I n=2 Tax=Pseudonocardia TaxID=1847 RepID=F4CJ62_PSEUX|nr:hypothetical protein [Pseudonocardia dioxanivorans]AEA23912.1 ATP synthase I [Pseudonocardia dioxanivorans CB1190]GJF05112.1 hypothetical protein PSD17_40650 [Pseudonocardia sp. D17]
MTAVPGYVPPVTRATFRRTAIIGAAVALVAVAVLVPLGYGLFALFGCVGIALGILNSAFAMGSVVRFSHGAAAPSKAKFSGGVLVRLAVITVVAFGCAFLVRPQGVAVFVGLAVFQLLATVSSILPLIKEIRQK